MKKMCALTVMSASRQTAHMWHRGVVAAWWWAPLHFLLLAAAVASSSQATSNSSRQQSALVTFYEATGPGCQHASTLYPCEPGTSWTASAMSMYAYYRWAALDQQQQLADGCVD